MVSYVYLFVSVFIVFLLEDIHLKTFSIKILLKVNSAISKKYIVLYRAPVLTFCSLVAMFHTVCEHRDC